LRVLTLGLSLSVFALMATGCNTKEPLQKSPQNTVAQSTPTNNPSILLSNPIVKKDDGKDLSISLSLNNTTSKAISVDPKEFALVSGATVLTPASTSQVPAQIPAHVKATVLVTFNVLGRLKGNIKPKLAFQPNTNISEEFFALGTIKIPQPKAKSSFKPKAATKSQSKPVPTSSSTPKTSTTPKNHSSDTQQYIIKINGTPSANGEVELQFSGIPSGYVLSTLEMVEGSNSVTETLNQAAANNDIGNLSAQFSISPDGSVIVFGFDNAMGGGRGQFIFTFKSSSDKSITAKSAVFGILS